MYYGEKKFGDPKPEPKAKKVPKRIKSLSDKRKIQNDLYLQLRKVFLEKNPLCEVRLIGCSHFASQIHHDRKRYGELLTNEEYFVAICFNCHTLVENNNIKNLSKNENRNQTN